MANVLRRSAEKEEMVQHESVASIPNTIRFLSELLPPEPVVLGSVVTARADLSWLGAEGLRLLSSDITRGATTVRGLRLSSDGDLEALKLADSLTPGDSQLRLGHLFVAGSVVLDDDEEPLTVCFPLLTRRINLQYAAGSGTQDLLATPAGDLEVTSKISRIGDRHELLGSAPLVAPTTYIDPGTELHARTMEWIDRALRLLNIEIDDVDVATTHPFDRAGQPGLSIVPGYGVFLDNDDGPSTTTDAIREWADAAATSNTALATLIRPDLRPIHTTVDHDDGPLPMTVLGLDAEQELIVKAARTTRMITVTGAPGTGKSRTLAALALDAVRLNRTVLLATKTHRALDVLREFFDDMPGPDPVVFGIGQSASDMAERLERCLVDQFPAPTAGDEVPGDLAVRFAMEELNNAYSQAFRQFDSWFPDPAADTLNEITRRAPGLATEENRSKALELRNELDAWNPLRRRHAVSAFLELCQPADGQLETALVALEMAVLRESSVIIDDRQPPGELLGPVVDLLCNAREVIGQSAATMVENRVRGSNREQMHLLTQALRSTAATRREILGRLDATQVLSAEPIWLGTLDQIDEFLPSTPGLFDLVILDEASQIEIPNATSALGRAKFAVVVGDPKQTRYNSHDSTGADIDVVADRYHLDGPTRSRFDIRVNSVFDAAAAISPPITLRTHYRSRLHIIDFPARRFYGGQVDVATRHPKNEGIDAITEITIPGEQDRKGVNHAELAAVVMEVGRRIERVRDGEALGTLGIITPFPAQAEAITQKLTEAYAPEALLSLGLQVGTVDAFQGGERDTMIVSLAVAESSSRAALMFVNDPNVFNVMITRARAENIVLTSFATPPAGLMGDYLRAATVPPVPPPDVAIDDPWVNLLADDLRVGGATVRIGYQVGRHQLDLVVGDGASAIGVDARIDPAGTAQQITRRIELHELGWTILDVPESQWGMRRAYAVAEILARVSQ